MLKTPLKIKSQYTSGFIAVHERVLILWKPTANPVKLCVSSDLLHYTLQTWCCVLCPLNVGKHYRKKKKKKKEVLLLFISYINPLSLQCYHHSYKMITNPAICLKSPGWS